MSTTKKVIVYGASGYTGRLICEYLREFNLPFIAAGRDKSRIAQALDRVPGIDTVEHEIVEVAHEAGPLTELFAGASVVCDCAAAAHSRPIPAAHSTATLRKWLMLRIPQLRCVR